MALKIEAQAQNVLDAAAAEIRTLHPEDPSAFAKEPRVIAYLSVNYLIDSDLAHHPERSSYPLKTTQLHGLAKRSLRYARTYGWRVIFDIDGADIRVESLERITNSTK